MKTRSSCCLVATRIVGGSDDIDGSTCHYECSFCGQPCDVATDALFIVMGAKRKLNARRRRRSKHANNTLK